MKKEIRLLGFAGTAFDKYKRKETKVIGCFFRGGLCLDGVISFSVAIDGDDATQKMVQAIKKSRFYPLMQAILLKGIAVAGLNVIDITELSKKTKLPVIVVIRKKPPQQNIISVLKKLKMKQKIKVLQQAGEIVQIDKISVQFTGASLSQVLEILRISCTQSYIPEPLRVAHLIAKGITSLRSS